MIEEEDNNGLTQEINGIYETKDQRDIYKKGKGKRVTKRKNDSVTEGKEISVGKVIFRREK